MSKRNFRALLEAQWAKGNFVCVGLDSELGKIPEAAQISDPENPGNLLGLCPLSTIFRFNRDIVDATSHAVCAYKPNIAFYEEHGEDGWRALRVTIMQIHEVAPDVPVILDAKRADIGNTNKGYVQMLDILGADAITVHPYLGREALQPFLDRADKGIIVLCRTSNPGASEFQDLPIPIPEEVVDEMFTGNPRLQGQVSDPVWPLYQHVAYRVSRTWNTNGNCALVVGATYPDELQEVRRIVGDMPLLIPGVGFQQKDVPLEQQVEQVVSAGKDSRNRGMIINSSRGIIFASSGEDFAQAACRETEKLRDFINQYRQ